MTIVQTRVFGYLLSFVGSLDCDQLRRFLRFVTGGSTVLGTEIEVTFNTLDGFARRPISHTCTCTLEISTTYSTYPEFIEDFSILLASDTFAGAKFFWAMDAV